MSLPSNHTAKAKPTAHKVAAARAIQLDELSERATRRDPAASAEFGEILAKALENTYPMPDGRGFVTRLTSWQDCQGVSETLTVITSVTRESRVWAVMYAVKVGEAPTKEVHVGANSGLWQLASEIAAQVL